MCLLKKNDKVPTLLGGSSVHPKKSYFQMILRVSNLEACQKLRKKQGSMTPANRWVLFALCTLVLPEKLAPVCRKGIAIGVLRVTNEKGLEKHQQKE